MKPDLAVYGKAVANGYPIALLGGKKEWMDWTIHPEASKRVLIAGTYNAHPVPTAAAIATIERLLLNDGEVYRHVEALGAAMQSGLESLVAKLRNQGSCGTPGIGILSLLHGSLSERLARPGSEPPVCAR